MQSKNLTFVIFNNIFFSKANENDGSVLPQTDNMKQRSSMLLLRIKRNQTAILTNNLLVELRQNFVYERPKRHFKLYLLIERYTTFS